LALVERQALEEATQVSSESSLSEAVTDLPLSVEVTEAAVAAVSTLVGSVSLGKASLDRPLAAAMQMVAALVALRLPVLLDRLGLESPTASLVRR
jgi:hypothetical protein